MFNPTLEDFKKVNPNITIMGLFWAGFWRFWVVYFGICIVILGVCSLFDY